MRIIVDINAPIVDEFEDYLEASIASNQVESPLLEDTAKSNTKEESFEPKKEEEASPLNGNEKEEPLQQVINIEDEKEEPLQQVINIEDEKEEPLQQVNHEEHHDNQQMAVKAEKWMGVLVTKEFDGKSSMGKVMSYKEETKLFMIHYDNHVTEEVYFEELQQIVAPPVLVKDYLERFDPSENEEEKKKRLKRHMSDETVPVHPRYPSSLEPAAAAEPKRRKYKKGGSTSSNYVPLALREKKRDAYYYFY
ncbi:hypothetical protein COLO4_06090 [Corchorus olitorius]|uniref:PTM/DIR17-like Tudor domain-containing protein n=1 Tax=Corchorus olitorius TaxID=93759 RepID=A0A1R3KP32_9ROSI|nr:hypothetical protein COLO4_06090 [Corchorus olitorius]